MWVSEWLDLYDSAVNSKSDNDDDTEAQDVVIVNQRRDKTDVPFVDVEIGVVTMIPYQQIADLCIQLRRRCRKQQ